ncbi:MAG: sugar phosphate isomerase/epimerase [Synoicihabitans sp.]
MKTIPELSRRDFLAKTGAALACASIATHTPANLQAQESSEAKSKIRFSMYLYTLFNAPLPKEELDIAEVCRRTKAMGIDGLDFISNGYNRTWRQIKKIADDHGLKSICYTMGVSQMEAPDPATRAKGIDEFKVRLETAHILGTNRIMLNQGGKASGNSSAVNRKWMIDSLAETLPLAKAADIEVTIETHNSTVAPFRNSAHFSEALRQVPDLRVCFDTGNSFGNGEDPLVGYLANRRQITHMHFKDYAAGELGDARRICPPGTGLVDLPRIIQAMKANGYDGYINLERGGPDGFEVYRKSMEILGPLIA